MTIKCQVCGTENPDSNKYCDACGVELTTAPAAASAEVNTAEAQTEVASAAAPVATAAENVTTPSAPTSEVTPPAEAAAVPAPDAALPTEPAAPPATIGNGEPNPYQTPLSETPLGQVDEPAVPAAVPAAVPVEAAEAAPAPAAAAPATPGTDAPAKLGLKKFGQPTGEFIPLQGEKLVVGRFDASSGPVDIDLGEMAGKEHISRHHAELYREGGVWHVRDLGSTNGVFLKKKGESTFSPRLQEPAALSDGDELAFGNVMLTFNQG